MRTSHYTFFAFALLWLAACAELHAQSADAPSGPKLRLENMTKIPGTQIGFPSDDRYVFNRLRCDMNPVNMVPIYAYDDREVVRVHNDGDADLILQELDLSDPASFAFRKRDSDVLPITIKPGEHYDLILVFVKADAFWRGATGVYTSELTIKSNAGTKVVTLAGHYQLRPEGAWEPSVYDISQLFGFHCTVPRGLLPMEYPIAARMASQDYGDIVVSEYWEQADPNKPVSALFIYALGGGGDPNLKFLGAKGEVVADVDIRSKGQRQINGEMVWVCQTVFPWLEDDRNQVVGKTVPRIDRPFRLSISGRTTSGTGDIDPATGKPATLAFRFFHIKDERGTITKPNDYMVAYDVVPVNGSHANGDFNDYVLYLSNIRPKDNKPEFGGSR